MSTWTFRHTEPLRTYSMRSASRPRFILVSLLYTLLLRQSLVEPAADVYLPSLISTTGKSPAKRAGALSSYNVQQPNTKPLRAGSAHESSPSRKQEDQDELELTVQSKGGSQLAWRELLREWMEPWDERRGGRAITRELLDNATQAFMRKDYVQGSGVMPKIHMQPDVWRAQIVDGALYIKEIHLLQPWSRYSASMKLILLETLRRHPNLPNVDILVNQYDDALVSASPKAYVSQPPPPLLSPTRSPSTHDLPFPDFSFLYPLGKHRLVTGRWDEEHRRVLAAGRAIPWDRKIDRAVFSGNVKVQLRKAAARVAAKHPEEMFVNSAVVFDANVTDTDCFDLAWRQQYGRHSKQRRLNPAWEEVQDAARERMRGVQYDKCQMRFEDLCRFKYLLSIGGNSYSNRLKYLHLCGSVVINVRNHGHHAEFYEFLLNPGVHHIQVDDVRSLPRVIRELRGRDAAARQMAERGTAILARLDLPEVCRYVAETLKMLAAHEQWEVEPVAGAVRVQCEDDLWERYGLDGGPLSDGQDFRTHDPGRCIQPLSPGRYNYTAGSARWEYDKRYHASLPRFVPPGESVQDQPPVDGL